MIIQMVDYSSNGMYKISRQDTNNLLVIMRSIYLFTPTNAIASGDSFQMDMCTLNKNVLDYIVPHVLVNIQQYLGYTRDQGNNPRPLQQPEFMSNRGTKITHGLGITYL
jgi:hypothetical protein